MKNFSTLNFSIKNNIAEITLNRPNNTNSLNLVMGKELLECAIHCENDSSVRAVLLTGIGRMFCAGGDLNSFVEFGERIDQKAYRVN